MFAKSKVPLTRLFLLVAMLAAGVFVWQGVSAPRALADGDPCTAGYPAPKVTENKFKVFDNTDPNVSNVMINVGTLDYWFHGLVQLCHGGNTGVMAPGKNIHVVDNGFTRGGTAQQVSTPICGGLSPHSGPYAILDANSPEMYGLGCSSPPSLSLDATGAVGPTVTGVTADGTSNPNCVGFICTPDANAPDGSIINLHITFSAPHITINSYRFDPKGLDLFLKNEVYGVATLNVALTVTCSAVPGACNSAPTAPSVTGPTIGITNTDYPFTATSTDPDGDTLRYGYDWDKNGTVDQWVPASGYVTSGTGQTATHQWPTIGAKAFQVLAEDSKAAKSGWTPFTITIHDPSELPSVDIKANNSDGPVTVFINGITASYTLSWGSANVTTCAASGAWGGNQAVSGSLPVSNEVPGTYTYTLTCTGILGQASDSVVVIVKTLPTLTVNLTANPSSGVDTLATVLSAAVGGTATGTINYRFWWDCNNPSNSVATVTASSCGTYNDHYDAVNTNPQTTPHVYGAPGSYWAKVIVERDVATPVEMRINIIVTSSSGGNQPPNVTLLANGQPDTLTVILPGSGSVSYTLTWITTSAPTVCNAGGDWSGSQAANGGQKIITKNAVGVYTYTLTCTNSVGLATSQVIVTVQSGSPPPPTLTATLTANQTSSTTTPFTPTFTGTAGGTENAPNGSMTFWWDCDDPTTDYNTAVSKCGDPANPAVGYRVSSTTQFPPNFVTRQFSAAGYQNTGSYTAKVIITRGSSAPAQAQLLISVTYAGGFNVTLRAMPSAVQVPTGSPCWLSTASFCDDPGISNLRALIYNNPNPKVDYYFWCDRPDSSTVLTADWNYHWTVPDEAGLYVFGNVADAGFFAAPDNAYGLEQFDACPYNTAGTYAAKVIASSGAVNVMAHATILGFLPPLTVSLVANPSIGSAPLTTTLTATVGGTATGNIDYYFWWHCGTIISANDIAGLIANCGDPSNPAIGKEFLSDANNPQSTVHNYGNISGNVLPLVAVVRGGNPPAFQNTTVVITPPTLTASLTATPNSGIRPLSNVQLSANYVTTATGTVKYTFWWNCLDPSNDVATVTADPSCGDPTNAANGFTTTVDPAVDPPPKVTIAPPYTNGGTYTAKVIIERGAALPSQAQTTITVSAPAPTVSFTINNSPGPDVTAYIGDPLTFAWSSTDATTVSGSSNNWTRTSSAPNCSLSCGNATPTGTADQYYWIQLSGPGGTTGQIIRVIFKPKPQNGGISPFNYQAGSQLY